MRRVTFVTNYIYHIYNRGVEKRKIYLNSSYYSRFLSILEHYLNYDYPYSLLKQRLNRTESPEKKQKILSLLETRRISPPVEIISFCLMPNHYHLTVKQLVDNGITNFMHRIGTGYTSYFNLRKDRVGRLFESSFKAVMVKSNEQLIHLSRYQHLNPRTLNLNTLQELINYPWSSLSTYLGKKQFPFVKPDIVLSNFKDRRSYLKFVLEEADELEPLRLEKVAIDDDFNWFSNFRALEKNRKELLRQRYLKTLSSSLNQGSGF